MATVQSEGFHAAEFLISELPADRSRKNVFVLSGQVLVAGQVCGSAMFDTDVGRASVPAVVGTGNGLLSAVFPGPNVQAGNYVVTCKTAAANGGVFSVVAPDGDALPDATVGTAYRTEQINFSIADGSTDFIVGDVFTIVVGGTDPTVVGTGNGTISGLSLGPDAKVGLYRVECIEAVTNGGKFKVVGPDGSEVAVGSIVAGAGGTWVLANQRQLNLTVTDGSTDFAVGDYFNVAAFKATPKSKIVAFDPTAVGGTEDVAGILLAAVDATSGDKMGILICRSAAVKKDALVWKAGIADGQKDDAIDYIAKTLGIDVRSANWQTDD